jgi:hypothetical protein
MPTARPERCNIRDAPAISSLRFFVRLGNWLPSLLRDRSHNPAPLGLRQNVPYPRAAHSQPLG